MKWKSPTDVVNCSQIFCTFAVETTLGLALSVRRSLWIALKFFVLLQSKQQVFGFSTIYLSCELLSNFLYFCSRNNLTFCVLHCSHVVNCSQIFCTFAVETTRTFIFIIWASCELLSNFLYFCSRNNRWIEPYWTLRLWIALKFFVLLQSKQHGVKNSRYWLCCELLSNFLYFCSRNNGRVSLFS